MLGFQLRATTTGAARAAGRALRRWWPATRPPPGPPPLLGQAASRRRASRARRAVLARPRQLFQHLEDPQRLGPVRHLGGHNRLDQPRLFAGESELQSLDSAAVGSFFAAFVALLVVPMFVVGYTVLWLSFLAPLISYIVVRNKAAKPDEKVLTRKHIRRWMAAQAVKLGMKVKEEALDPRDAGPRSQVFPARRRQRAQTMREHAQGSSIARLGRGPPL